MNVTIDRIESGIAVLIGREDELVRMTIPVALLPTGLKEGDVLTLSFLLNEQETRAAKDRVATLQERLKGR